MPTVQEMQQQDDAFNTAAVNAQSAKAAAAALAPQGTDPEAPAQPSMFSKWVLGPVGRVSSSLVDSAISAANNIYSPVNGKSIAQNVGDTVRKGRDVVSGAVTGATNMADVVMSHLASGAAAAGDQEDSFAAQQQMQAEGIKNSDLAQQGEPIWNHAKNTLLDFRDAVAVKDPTLSDNLTQSVAQLAIPYAGFSRALSGVHAVAQLATAGALTDATALGPHDARMADMISLGRHMEGKLGDSLRALAPDGSAVNAYINYLTDRTNESEAEGRFKNVLDGFGVNLIATPLIHGAAMVLKQGMSGLRYMLDNGVTSSGGMVPPGAQRGAVGDLSTSGRPPLRQAAADPADDLYTQQVRQDMARGAANPDAPRPPLQQGVDPAESIFDQQVKEDMANAPPASTLAATASPLENDKALASARAIVQTQSAAGRSGSTHDVVTGLAQHMDDSTPDGAFYKDIFSRLSDKQLATRLVPPGTEGHPSVDMAPAGARGLHITSNDTTSLYPPTFKSNANFAHTLAHESVHAGTMKALAAQPDVRASLAEIAGEAHEHSNALKKPDQYGFTDAKEFVAEAESNPRFQNFLKSIKDSEGNPLWDRYKQVIGGIFGFSGVTLASPMFDKLLTQEKTGGT